MEKHEKISIGDKNYIHKEISMEDENNIYKNIHIMLKNNINPLDRYKDFIYDIHNADPIIHAKWADQLHDFPVWKQIMKDFMKQRDTDHIKKVYNGYNHIFIDFDGQSVTYICECGKIITDSTSAHAIPDNEIGDEVYTFMLCHCDE